MTVATVVLGIILIVVSVALILIVLFQEGNQQNIATIQGGTDTYFDKGKTRSKDEKLALVTRVLAIAFFVLVFVTMLITHFASKQ